MPRLRFTPLELRIMRALWDRGPISIREIQEAFPEYGQPAYTTVQTTVYRLETKNAVRRRPQNLECPHLRGLGLDHAAQGRLIDDLLSIFGGRAQPVMLHMIETGKLTLEDVRQAEHALRKLRKDKTP